MSVQMWRGWSMMAVVVCGVMLSQCKRMQVGGGGQNAMSQLQATTPGEDHIRCYTIYPAIYRTSQVILASMMSRYREMKVNKETLDPPMRHYINHPVAEYVLSLYPQYAAQYDAQSSAGHSSRSLLCDDQGFRERC